MAEPIAQEFVERLRQISPKREQFAVEAVQLLLDSARKAGVSDIHLTPQPQGQYLLFWRIDGVLHPVTRIDQAGSNLVSRLKVLAELLTYRTDIPQEGRIKGLMTEAETRVSTFPTVHGEKGVVRLFADSQQYQHLNDLGFPPDLERELGTLLGQTAGAIVVSGPSGSGKTTTLYACLRSILSPANNSEGTALRAISTLEDPVECLIPGVAQTQIPQGQELTYARGLSSLMRQDPDIILVGEIRDRLTAETVFQAALTGHLILTSFHAGRSVEAISRLLDMKIEPYVIRSGLLGILSQRLLRRLCSCRQPGSSGHEFLKSGCESCGGAGYRGRIVLAELLKRDHLQSCQGLVDWIDTRVMGQLALEGGMIPLEQRLLHALRSGLTSREEAWRVLGPSVLDQLEAQASESLF